MSEPTASDPPVSRRELRRRRESAQTGTIPVLVPPDAATRPPTILTVCTGNICRSPLAEVLLRTRLPGSVRVHSAGTRALVGHGMPEEARELALKAGVETSVVEAHHARYLVEPILGESDLVLTMTREQRRHVVQMMPALVRRAFTLREFTRLAAGVSDERLRTEADAASQDAAARMRALARAVAAERGASGPGDDDDDVIDPYTHPRAVYEQAAAQIEPALGAVQRIAALALA